MCKPTQNIILFALIIVSLTVRLYGQNDSSHRPLNGIETRESLARQKAELWNKVDSVYLDIINLLKESSDSKMNVYKEYLEKAQINWKDYTENHCKIIEEQSKDGAQGGLSFYHSCIIDLSKIRLQELEEIKLNIQIE